MRLRTFNYPILTLQTEVNEPFDSIRSITVHDYDGYRHLGSPDSSLQLQKRNCRQLSLSFSPSLSRRSTGVD